MTTAPGLGYEQTYAALHDAVVGRLAERDVVIVSGPDAQSYLQGQCSQDLAGMAPGEARRSLLLAPQGKVVALVRVSCAAADRYAVEVEHGWGEVVEERLRRFKLRVKVDLELTAWRCAELRGPGAAGAMGWPGVGAVGAPGAPGGVGAPGALAGADPLAGSGAELLAIRLDDRFGHGVDLLGPAAALPPGVPAGEPAAFEAVRIEAGVPAMGSELDERTIPQEAGIVEETVSSSKGCYTGQELVARLEARGGRVPRILRGVVVATGGMPVLGSVLLDGEREVGTLTSVARSPRLGAVGLAYVRREVEPPATLRLAAAGAGDGGDGDGGGGDGGTSEAGRVEAVVRALPL